MSKYSEARKYVLSYIGLPVDIVMPYTILASVLKQRKDVIIEGIDINNKEDAKAFILSFATVKKYQQQRFKERCKEYTL